MKNGSLHTGIPTWDTPMLINLEVLFHKLTQSLNCLANSLTLKPKTVLINFVKFVCDSTKAKNPRNLSAAEPKQHYSLLKR
jgi:hypothetical protein